MSDGIHPGPAEFSRDELSVDPLLRFFHYSHLPAQLQIVSEPFCHLARVVISRLPRNAERTTALRKLLEAKDCAVRANLDNTDPTPPYLHRLRTEYLELTARLDKLAAFIDGPEFRKLPPEGSTILNQQYDAMERYSEILSVRLVSADPTFATDRNPELTAARKGMADAITQAPVLDEDQARRDVLRAQPGESDPPFKG